MYSFGFLWWGRIEVFPLLALPFALGLKMVAPCFVPCDDTWQKRIPFLVVPLQMTQTCSHSANRLYLRQLMRNPLRMNFSELQVIFDNGVHGAMGNVDLNTNLFFCSSSVFPDLAINSSNHIRRNDSVGLPERESFCSDVRPSRISSSTSAYLSGTFNVCQSSSTLSHQETNHISAPLCFPPFPMLVEHTLHYTHLQSNKEATLWTWAFSLCMSPTLQMAISMCNNSTSSFCEECVSWRVFGFHLTAPHK